MSDSDNETGPFDGPIQWTTPSSHPSYYAFATCDSDNETGPFDAHHKREQLHREVFQPMLSVLQKTHLPIPKRQRNLYGYNFSPPSTPNGNHTIAEREESRKAARIAIAAENDDCADFTPRCLMKQCIADQQALVQDGINVTDAEWNMMVSFLSPAKPPLHPNIQSRPCRFEFPSKREVTCVGISCAGLKAKPKCTPCLVCGGLSVCLKGSGAQSPVPSMCFKCTCAFLDRQN
jgi:hypothetical protein